MPLHDMAFRGFDASQAFLVGSNRWRLRREFRQVDGMRRGLPPPRQWPEDRRAEANSVPAPA